MKKITLILCLFFATFFSYCQDNNIIGKIENDKPVLTANADLLCKALSKNLLFASNIKEEFKTVELSKYGNFYLLIFRGKTYKTSFLVTVVNKLLAVSPKTSCTTSDNACSRDPNACVPSAGVGDCACTACPAEATCTKTCTDYSLIE